MAHGLFFIVGIRCRTIAHICPEVPKMPWVPWGSRSTSLSYEMWMLASLASCLAASINCHWNQGIPDLIRIPVNSASQSLSQPSELDLQVKITIQTLIFINHPTYMQVWHKAFLWVSSAGPLLTHTWRFQKCLEPHRHSPKKGCLRHQVINLAL